MGVEPPAPPPLLGPARGHPQPDPGRVLVEPHRLDPLRRTTRRRTSPASPTSRSIPSSSGSTATSSCRRSSTRSRSSSPSGRTGLFYGYFLSTVLLWHGTFSINSVMHLIGRRAYATTDDSRNSFLFSLITMGEGWHNNHHWAPGSAAQGFRWWQIDPSYYVLWLAERVGLVRDLHRPPARWREAAHDAHAHGTRLHLGAPPRAGAEADARWAELASDRARSRRTMPLVELEAARMRAAARLDHLHEEAAAARSARRDAGSRRSTARSSTRARTSSRSSSAWSRPPSRCARPGGPAAGLDAMLGGPVPMTAAESRALLSSALERHHAAAASRCACPPARSAQLRRSLLGLSAPIVVVHDERVFRAGRPLRRRHRVRRDLRRGPLELAGSGRPSCGWRSATPEIFDAGGAAAGDALAAGSSALRHFRRRNSVSGSRANIRYHYDLGTDFYSLFLDPSLTYSCARLRDAGRVARGGAARQARPHRRDARALAGRPAARDRYGLGRPRDPRRDAVRVPRHDDDDQPRAARPRPRAARAGGPRRTGSSSSSRTIASSRRPVRQGRLDRDVRGGRTARTTTTTSRRVDRLARAGRRDAAPDDQDERGALRRATAASPTSSSATSSPAASSRPSAEIRKSLARATGLEVVDVEEIGPHYVRRWPPGASGSSATRDRVRALGFPETFIRMWDYYLAYCEGGFAERLHRRRAGPSREGRASRDAGPGDPCSGRVPRAHRPRPRGDERRGPLRSKSRRRPSSSS